MNILFFLKPKNEIVYIYDDETVRQVLEKMEYHRYSAVPVVSKKNGTYVGTITEGDLLWEIKNRFNLSVKDAEDICIKDVHRNRDNQPVSAECKMEDLFSKVAIQNFVPVIDGSKCFIGIITRRDVIAYLMKNQIKKET